MILGFPRAKQGLCHTKHGGAGGIILWALLTVFLVFFKKGDVWYLSSNDTWLDLSKQVNVLKLFYSIGISKIRY